MRLACCLLVLFTGVASAQVQDLGHRIPGGVGLDAGTQNEPGLYLGDRFVWFSSNRVVDRNGNPVPIQNLDLDAYANAFGVAATIEVAPVYITFSAAVPVVRSSLSADQPEASIERLGLGDVFLEPIKLGTRSERFDAVASYAFYVPTRQGARTRIGEPEWSHQFAAGGTLFFDDHRGSRFSLLASYVHHQQKLEVDITRGDTLLFQGGIGVRFKRVIDVGLAGYALWQVTDDSGSELPEMLRGARERVFGLGPEVDVAIPCLRSRLTARFEWDIGGRARPVGTILFLGLPVVAWRA